MGGYAKVNWDKEECIVHLYKVDLKTLVNDYICNDKKLKNKLIEIISD